MATTAGLRIIALCSAALALFTAGFSVGQYQSPTDYKGVQESEHRAADARLPRRA
jgi:hypothetical protein